MLNLNDYSAVRAAKTFDGALDIVNAREFLPPAYRAELAAALRDAAHPEDVEEYAILCAMAAFLEGGSK